MLTPREMDELAKRIAAMQDQRRAHDEAVRTIGGMMAATFIFVAIGLAMLGVSQIVVYGAAVACVFGLPGLLWLLSRWAKPR